MPSLDRLARHALAGLAGGDHACCSFGSDEEQQALVGRYALDALARGERLLYIADRSDDARLGMLLARAGIDVEAALASTQLELVHTRDTYLAGEAFDAGRQMELLRAEAHRSRAEGFRGLAVAAEMSWVLERPEVVPELMDYERRVTAVFEQAPMHAICQYDRRLFATETLATVDRVHPCAVRTDASGSAVRHGRLRVEARAAEPAIALRGELDFLDAGYLRDRLAAQVDDDGDVLVDAGPLAFADVAGCRAIAAAVRQGPQPDRRVRIVNASPTVRRVLELAGWLDDDRLATA